MRNGLKKELGRIQIPDELRRRSLAGIERAAAELGQSAPEADVPRRGTERRNSGRKLLAAAVAGTLLLSAAVFNTQVMAAIQKMLQFVPGIGMVEEKAVQMDRYVLEKPITVPIGSGTVVITGMMVDERMTLMMMTGTGTARFDHVKLINGAGTEYTVHSSLAVSGGKDWSASFWHKGKLDIGEQVRMVVEGNPETVVPLTLVRAETFGSFGEMGETATAQGVQITAIPTRVDGKARISLVSQYPDRYRIDSYGITGSSREDRKTKVADETGKTYEIDNVWGLTAPASEFYFPLAADGEAKRYTVTIPEINVVDRDRITLTLPVPAEGFSPVNRHFELAGFPVTITGIERLSANEIRIYTDLAYREDAAQSLHMFNIDGESHMAKVNEETDALEYLQMNVEPGAKRVKLTLSNPQITLRGPWTFEFPVERYFGR